MGTRLRSTMTAAILILTVLSVSAQTDSLSKRAAHQEGIVFSVAYWNQESSINRYDDPPGTCVMVGLGYLLNSRLLVSLKIHTGSETIPAADTHPYSGRKLLGGAGVDLQYLFNENSILSPFITGGFDAYTVIDRKSVV